MTRESDQPPATGNDGAVERKWYVEEGGAFVGPLERSALAQKWRDGEIGAATLVWADGFAGWLPLGDVPELADVWGAPRDSAKTNFATADWAAVKAPGVNTLFRREVNPPPPRRAGEVRLGPPEFPAVVASEASGWRGQLANIQRVTMTGLNKAWRSLHDAQRHSRRMTLVAVVATCCALVAGGALVLERRPAPVAPATMAAPATAPATGAVTTPSAASAAGAVPATGAVAATGAALAPGAPPATPSPDPNDARPAVAAPPAAAVTPAAPTPPPRAPAPAAAPAPAHHPEPAAPGDAASEEEADSEPPSPAADAAAAPLDKAEMIAATKAQVATLGACIKEARRTGELQPQRYTFVLDWVIEPDGAVSSPALKGPPELLGTSVRPCFEAALARWHYRASAQPTRVSNFPLSVTVP